ncbi:MULTISPECIES: hypothetical protein [Pandoraea]|uniref:Integrase n=1 Tax=Pandoraea capi TaxID=2508286 RepID=A0ABY6VT01_9BURK|nr:MULTISPECIES: hypothetical protein [Pandoraea]MCI3207854.1 hypothetical protein [Pandoraea sp. LA3]MDN4585883.1 hypothetical protein [Pandoraea capi]ODP33408.1 hypothetical protein A9762_18975 [Pandoraea sp. ISTKB]VVD80543.1 hypothetical protein PCA20602_01093 [Pandoraea capi]
MAAKVVKYLQDGVTYYEIRGALPDGTRYVDRVGFSERELAFRHLVAARIKLLRQEYDGAHREALAQCAADVVTPRWVRQLIF